MVSPSSASAGSPTTWYRFLPVQGDPGGGPGTTASARGPASLDDEAELAAGDALAGTGLLGADHHRQCTRPGGGRQDAPLDLG